MGAASLEAPRGKNPSEQGSSRQEQLLTVVIPAKVLLPNRMPSDYQLVRFHRSSCSFHTVSPNGQRKELVWAGCVNYSLSSKAWLMSFNQVLWELKFWAPWKKLHYGLHPYQRIPLPSVNCKQTDLWRSKGPVSFDISPATFKSGGRFSWQGNWGYYSLSVVTRPQSKFWSVGTCVKFKTAIRGKE